MTYPLPEKTPFSYKTNPRAFNSPRVSTPTGRRHGALDFYAKHGTPILCIRSGVVTLGPYNFVKYDSLAPYVLAIEVQCGAYEKYPNLTMRYGEAVFLPNIVVGYRVTEGEHIGWIVRMKGLMPPGNAMLHLEMYSGSQKGSLTQRLFPYYRRSDLFDPTELADNFILAPTKTYRPIPDDISNKYLI